MSWPRFILSTCLLLLVLIGIMYPISEFNDLPAIVVAWGTVMLAYTTFLLIRHGRDQENRDRKERVLNEIIAWLKGIEYDIFPSERRIVDSKAIREDMSRVSKSGISIENWQSLKHTDESLLQFNSLGNEIKEGEYIQKLAKNINEDLGGLIEHIVYYMQQRRELIIDSLQRWQAITDIAGTCEGMGKESDLVEEFIKDDSKPLEDSGLSQDGLNTVRFGRNAGNIRKSILSAIDKMIDIKMSLVNN